MLDGGKRADDKDLKEKRLKKKKAAEKRLKVKVRIFQAQFSCSFSIFFRFLGRPLVTSMMRMGCLSRYNLFEIGSDV